MGNITNAINAAFRDFATDGVSSSGAHEVVKSEVRAIGPILEEAIGLSALGSIVDVVKTTKALLDADLAHAANTVALVYADATAANNDLYVKSGASGAGSWANTGALQGIVASLISGALQSVEDAAAEIASFLVPKKNLFDKATMIRNGKRYSPGSDQVITEANGKCTTFIPVTPGQRIAISGGETGFTGGWFATASDTGTATDLGFATGVTSMIATVPDGRFFLVVNLTASNSSAYNDTLQIEVAEWPTAYEAYTLVIDPTKIKDADKWPVMVSEVGTNLIDLTKINYVKRYSTGGKNFTNDELGIAASDWIAVEEGQTYTLSGSGAYNIANPQGGYFTAYGNATAPTNITFFATPDGNGKSFTVPTGQGITHVVVSLRKLNDLVASTSLHGPVQLEEGEYASAWQSYEVRQVVSEDNIPKSVLNNSGGGSGSAGFDAAAWLRYVGGEGVPSHLDKWPVFREHYLAKDKDLTVVITGTSLTARTTEHHSDHPLATIRPPLMHSLNLASYIWDKLEWPGQHYKRYDAADGGTEPSGTWATAFNLTEWDDGGYRNGLTRYSSSAGASFTREVPEGAYSWRLIYRTDSLAPTTVTVAVSGGNNQMQVYDEGTSSWVEANGYTFSQREATPTTRSISIPNPDTGSSSSLTIASKGNTTYQKRLKFRCKWSGVDTRTTAKTITFTNTSGGRLMYWGHEWSRRPYMVTLINAARGSHNTQATETTGLPRYADNEVHGFEPDLIYMELPIHNDGAAGIGQYATWDRWGRLTNNYVFNASYELALLTRATALGYTPEIGMWTPSIAYGFGGIGEDGQLLFSDQTDGVPMCALDKFDQAAAWVAENHPEVVFVNAVRRWVEAGFAIYGDLKTATNSSSKTGPSMTNDGGHANDVGDKILAKVVLGPLCFEK